MDILAGLRQFKFYVLDHVKAEIRHPDQQARLGAALAAGIISELEITEPPEILLFDEFRKFLGDGESACLSVAVSRRWVIAADEKGRFRRELFERLGEAYLLDTPGALVAAIKGSLITIQQAEELREPLRQHRFEMDPRPFEELLGEE
jgi:predicted nucleic acid-binding protein